MREGAKTSHACNSTDGVSTLGGEHFCGLLRYLRRNPLIGVLLAQEDILW